MLRPADQSNEGRRQLERQRGAVMKDLKRIFPRESDLQKWLDAPNDQLGGRKPSEMLGTPDQQHVVDLIEAVKSGAFS